MYPATGDHLARVQDRPRTIRSKIMVIPTCSSTGAHLAMVQDRPRNMSSKSMVIPACILLLVPTFQWYRTGPGPLVAR